MKSFEFQINGILVVPDMVDNQGVMDLLEDMIDLGVLQSDGMFTVEDEVISVFPAVPK